tara:strand:- start:195625 stop:195999 length:375 start_codon:yes stop_codon:yes gene_type:complete
MKLITLLILITNISFARQYIQCAHSNSYDRMVINLDGDASTLFLTTGVHDPNELRVLKDLFLVSSGDDFYHYETRDGLVKEEIIIKSEYIDRALGYFVVDFKMTKLDDNYSQTYEVGCFSSLHD